MTEMTKLTMTELMTTFVSGLGLNLTGADTVRKEKNVKWADGYVSVDEPIVALRSDADCVSVFHERFSLSTNSFLQI